MKKYVKVQDGEIVAVFHGTDLAWADSQGFVEADVDPRFCDPWYILGRVPESAISSLYTQLRAARDVCIGDVLWMRERHADELELGKETSLTQEQYTALLTYIQALRDLPAQPGAPWDGGGEDTPWPELPSVG